MKQANKSAACDKDGLRLRESVFCSAYLLNGGNASQAAITAGYKGDSTRRGSMLLKRPRVAAVIRRETEKALTEIDAKKELILRELVRIAFFDPRNLFRPDGSLIPIAQLTPQAAAGISAIDVRPNTVKLRFHSKSQALELLGDYLGLWDGKGDGPKDRLNEVINVFQFGPTKKEEQ